MTVRLWLPLAFGFGAMAALVLGLMLWAARVEIAGAVVAPGIVVVEDERQIVQHQEGGVVGAILARDGDRVAAGAVLLRFDGTYLVSERALIDAQLFEIRARRARLTALRDDRDGPDFGPLSDLPAAGDADWAAERIAGEVRLFEVRAAAALQEARQVDAQADQIADEVAGLAAELAAREAEADIAAGERADQEALFKGGLVPAARVMALRREAARLDGEIGRLRAAMAAAEGRVAALRLDALKRAEERRGEAIAEIAADRSREIALTERRLVLSERMARLEVRAPVAGTVFGSRVAALQSVVRAAEPIMYLVPGDGRLQVSARVPPGDIDVVYPGQPVDLRFSAFDQRQRAPVPGRVLRLSADVVVDEAGQGYFEAVIVPDREGLAGLAAAIVPGMPVEAFIRTEDRTAMAYLTEPLSRYFARAFRGG